MPKLAKVNSIQRLRAASGDVYFRVRFPAGVTTQRFTSGKISRRTVYRSRKFTSERTAREFVTDLSREHRGTGEAAHLITDGAKRALVQIYPKVRGRGETMEGLLSDLSGALDSLDSLKDPVTGKVPRLLDAVQDYARLIKPTLGTQPIEDEVELYLDATDKRAESGVIQVDSAKAARIQMSRFLKSKLASQPLGFFSTKAGSLALKKWLDALPVGPTTYNNYRRHLSIFFGWAVKEGKLQKNPCSQLEERRKSREQESEVGIITPAEFRTLLLVAKGEVKGIREDDRWSQLLAELVPGIAIQGFCGVRARELTRLNWESVDLDEKILSLSKGRTKTRKGRLIPIPDALIKWLAPYVRKSGPVAPKQYERKMSNLRAIMRKPPKQGGEATFNASEIPDNCLRHSFGTYHLAISKNEAETSRLMGNSPGVLREHYESLSKKAPRMAPEWFNTLP